MTHPLYTHRLRTSSGARAAAIAAPDFLTSESATRFLDAVDQLANACRTLGEVAAGVQDLALVLVDDLDDDDLICRTGRFEWAPDSTLMLNGHRAIALKDEWVDPTVLLEPPEVFDPDPDYCWLCDLIPANSAYPLGLCGRCARGLLPRYTDDDRVAFDRLSRP